MPLSAKIILSVVGVLILTSSFSRGQGIVAGDTSSPSTVIYYEDIPDDTLSASPWSSPTPFAIDINGDNINDLRFHAYVSPSLGAGFKRVYIETLNNTQIASGYLSPCYSDLIPIAQGFSSGSTIDSSAIWKSSPYVPSVIDTSIHLAYNYFQTGGNSCGDNPFYYTRYLGVRVLAGNDTLYGWVKCRTQNSYMVITYSFACNLNIPTVTPPEVPEQPEEPETASLIKIYPIPASDFFIVELQNLPFTGMEYKIYNATGAEIARHTVLGTAQMIPIENLDNGIYYLEYENLKYKFVKISK
jgi:hypothetical protein